MNGELANRLLVVCFILIATMFTTITMFHNSILALTIS